MKIVSKILITLPKTDAQIPLTLARNYSHTKLQASFITLIHYTITSWLLEKTHNKVLRHCNKKVKEQDEIKTNDCMKKKWALRDYY